MIPITFIFLALLLAFIKSTRTKLLVFLLMVVLAFAVSSCTTPCSKDGRCKARIGHPFHGKDPALSK